MFYISAYNAVTFVVLAISAMVSTKCSNRSISLLNVFSTFSSWNPSIADFCDLVFEDGRSVVALLFGCDLKYSREFSTVLYASRRLGSVQDAMN